MPVQFTTDLPDADTLALDATEAESLTAMWDSVTNNGEYRLEIRDDDPDGNHPPYELETTVPWDGVLEHTIPNLLGGEQYSVRVRTQTEHVTGQWLAAEEITKLIASDSVAFANVGETSLEVQWTINNNFRGSHQIYRQRTDYDYDEDGRLIDTVASSTSSFVDDSVAPGREYEYHVRTLTQWQFADSDPATTATTSTGLEQQAVPPRGWHVEIDHPSGTTLTPDPLEGARRQPTINGFPRVEIPVPFAERWHSTAFDDADIRVWHDGDREPINQLEHRSLEEGSGSKQTVLEARGGTQLDQRVIEDVDIQPTHEFVRYLLDKYTDYSYNVDNPDNNQEQAILQAAGTDVELQQALDDIPDTTPVTVSSDGHLEPLQAAWYQEGQTADGFYQDEWADDAYSGGLAGVVVGENDDMSMTINPGYRIPKDSLEVWTRLDIPADSDGNGSHHAFQIVVDNVIVHDVPADSMAAGHRWTTWPFSMQSDVEDSDIEIRLDCEGGSERFAVDGFAFLDNRFPWTRDSSVHEAGGYLDGPERFPDLAQVKMLPIETPISISEVSLEVTTEDGVPVSELGIGVNGTDTYDTVTDALTHSLTYTELSTTARARIGVGRRDDVTRNDATPRTGFEPERVDSLEMTGILDDTPVLTNRNFDRQFIDVLREAADIGNFVFEVRENDGVISIEWTQLGQRSVSIDPEITDYSVDRQTEDVVEKAVVYGGAASITRQSVTVSIGEWVDLPFPDSKIVTDKETIYEGDTEFEQGTDYRIRYATEDGQPRIMALADGALSDGQTVGVDADVKPRGEYTEGGAGENPNTTIQDIPGLASKQMCDQYALYAVEETGDAIVDASVTIPEEEVGASLVDAIDIERLPGDDPWEVTDISYGDGEVSVELGNGPSADEFLQQVNDRTKRNSERV